MTYMTDQIILGDFADIVKDIPPGSIGLIYTDPPYKKQLAIPCYQLLAEWSLRILSDGGSLVTIVPHYLLTNAVAQLASSGLKYRWVYCLDQEDGPHPRMAMGVEVVWKPMLHYVKGSYPSGRGFLRDKVRSRDRDKRHHKWQQSEDWAEYYISKLNGGGVVLDPFCGTGTVPVVCKRLGVPFIGIDIDPVAVKMAKDRLDDHP